MSQQLRSANTTRPAYYDFEQQLLVSKEGESVFCNYMNYLKRKNMICSFQDVTSDSKYQSQDIDFIVLLSNGKTVRWEVKCDTYTTGNLFAETHVNSYYLTANGKVDSSRHTLGWIYKSCADMIFYYFSKYRVAYIFPRAEFCYWLDKKTANRNVPFRMSAAPNKNKRSNAEFYFGVGVLVPLSLLQSDPEISDTVKVITQDLLVPQPKFVVPHKNFRKK